MTIFGHIQPFLKGYHMFSFSISDIILCEKFRENENFVIFVKPRFGVSPLKWGRHFGTSWDHFKLKLGKLGYSVIFSIFSDFVNFENLNIFRSWSHFGFILALTFKLQHPLQFRRNIVWQ